jgi:hypothetical protein
MVFTGTLEQLKTFVASLELPCHWENKGSFEMAVFDSEDSDLRLNWWPETGRLEITGEPKARLPLQERLKDILAP